MGHPPSAIRLGNIIADPTAPHRPLLTATQPLPIGDQASAALISGGEEPSPASLVPTIDTQIHTIPKTNFRCTFSHHRSNTWGLFAQFLSVFGIGAEGNVSFSRESADSYAFERLETRWFEPSRAFVEVASREANVQGFLRSAGRRTPVYVVTGIKIVSGATVSTAAHKSHGYGGKVGFDATSVGVPVTVGPQGGRERGVGEEVGWSCEGPLVFAYQLKRVVYRDRGSAVKDYNKRALFGVHRGDAGEDGGAYVLEDLPDVSGQQEDTEADGALMESLGEASIVPASDEGDGEICTVIIPETDEVM